jgi:hypothetical protein
MTTPIQNITYKLPTADEIEEFVDMTFSGLIDGYVNPTCIEATFPKVKAFVEKYIQLNLKQQEGILSHLSNSKDPTTRKFNRTMENFKLLFKHCVN